MIKHIVIWKLKEFAQGNDRATNARLFKQNVESLRGKIPGLLAIEVGIDYSGTGNSGDVVLYSEFDSRASLDGYQAHPLHQAIIPFGIEVTSERRMVDYEI